MCYIFLDGTKRPTQRETLYVNHFLGKCSNVNHSHYTGDRCHEVKDTAPQKHFGVGTLVQAFNFPSRSDWGREYLCDWRVQSDCGRSLTFWAKKAVLWSEDTAANHHSWHHIYYSSVMGHDQFHIGNCSKELYQAKQMGWGKGCGTPLHNAMRPAKGEVIMKYLAKKGEEMSKKWPEGWRPWGAAWERVGENHSQV